MFMVNKGRNQNNRNRTFLKITGMLLAGLVFFANTVFAESLEEYQCSDATWDVSDHVMMAYWNPSEADQRYRVDLYKNDVAADHKIGKSRTVTNKDHYDFSKEIQNLGAGDYVFTVEGMKGKEIITSEILHLSWEDFHEIQDRYRDEHPKSVAGIYRTPEVDRINGVKRSYRNVNDGWVQLKDQGWYHFTDSKMDTGWIQDPQRGKRYYLQENGIMMTGWAYIDGHAYFFGADGSLQSM